MHALCDLRKFACYMPSLCFEAVQPLSSLSNQKTTLYFHQSRILQPPPRVAARAHSRRQGGGGGGGDGGGGGGGVAAVAWCGGAVVRAAAAKVGGAPRAGGGFRLRDAVIPLVAVRELLFSARCPRSAPNARDPRLRCRLGLRRRHRHRASPSGPFKYFLRRCTEENYPPQFHAIRSFMPSCDVPTRFHTHCPPSVDTAVRAR